MLELTAISKSFSDVQVLDSLNLSVAPGSRTAIVGPSGSGKTTLLRILAGFETPDTGRIVMQGRTLFDENSFVPAHLRRIGFVPQEGALFPHLNVADNIAWGLDGTRHEKRQRVAALMEMVSLDRQLATHWPHEISGGQQQRVALARALAQRPSLMLLDEPFSALDTGVRQRPICWPKRAWPRFWSPTIRTKRCPLPRRLPSCAPGASRRSVRLMTFTPVPLTKRRRCFLAMP